MQENRSSITTFGHVPAALTVFRRNAAEAPSPSARVPIPARGGVPEAPLPRQTNDLKRRGPCDGDARAALADIRGREDGPASSARAEFGRRQRAASRTRTNPLCSPAVPSKFRCHGATTTARDIPNLLSATRATSSCRTTCTSERPPPPPKPPPPPPHPPPPPPPPPPHRGACPRTCAWSPSGVGSLVPRKGRPEELRQARSRIPRQPPTRGTPHYAWTDPDLPAARAPHSGWR
jgi:hypothetical protein